MENYLMDRSVDDVKTFTTAQLELHIPHEVGWKKKWMYFSSRDENFKLKI